MAAERPGALTADRWPAGCKIVFHGLHIVVIELRQTDIFARWLSALKDRKAAARIAERLRRLALGNPGDVKPVGDGLSELRIDYGSGYRVYCVRRGAGLIIILCGGDKAGQSRDIARAKALAEELEP
jgi:putative addiction module killer protein